MRKFIFKKENEHEENAIGRRTKLMKQEKRKSEKATAKKMSGMTAPNKMSSRIYRGTGQAKTKAPCALTRGYF